MIASVTGNLKQGTLASPTGLVEFWDSVDGGAPQLLTILQLTPGAAGASVAGARLRLAGGTHSLHIHYRGDNNWQAANSASAGAPSYSLSLVPDPMSFKGGNMGTATIQLTPGATSAAAVQSGIAGATFWVVAGLWWVALGAGVFAYRGRELLSATLRSRRAWANSWAWARGSAALAASLMIGCGGGGGGDGGNITPPAPTTTAIAVQQAGNQWNVVVTVHSSGAAPTGTVSLIVDGGVSLASGVSAGQASFNFSPSPMVGIHTLDAHYAGDAKNEASDSGVRRHGGRGRRKRVEHGVGTVACKYKLMQISYTKKS